MDEKKGQEGSKVATSSTKGVVIHEKQPWEEVLEFSPNKKGKIDESKWKQTMSPPKVKKTKSNKGRARIPSSQLLERALRPNLATC